MNLKFCTLIFLTQFLNSNVFFLNNKEHHSGCFWVLLIQLILISKVGNRTNETDYRFKSLKRTKTFVSYKSIWLHQRNNCLAIMHQQKNRHLFFNRIWLDFFMHLAKHIFKIRKTFWSSWKTTLWPLSATSNILCLLFLFFFVSSSRTFAMLNSNLICDGGCEDAAADDVITNAENS